MSRRVTRRLTRLQTMYKEYRKKHDEIKTKYQITATATEPHRNRKFRQFNKDQYCNVSLIRLHNYSTALLQKRQLQTLIFQILL